MNQTTVSASTKGPQGTVARTFCDYFFLGMSCLLLLITLVGFTRTFYIRSYLGLSDLPIHLFIHGIVLTAWFSLVLIQTCLVTTHRIHIHRRLGAAGISLAACVVVVSVLTVFRRDAPVIEEFPQRAFGNLASLIGFSLCIVAGILLRHRPAAHKRLMILASIQIVAPALDRIARLTPINEFFGVILAWFPAPPEIAFALVSTILLILLVLTYDLVSRRRPHPATLGGILCIFVIAPAVSAAITFSGLWYEFVRWVG